MHDSIDELMEPGRESESAMSSAVRRKQESMATLNAARLARYQKIQAEIEEEGKRRIEQSKARAEKRFNYLYDTVFHGMLDPAGVIPQVCVVSSAVQPRTTYGLSTRRRPTSSQVQLRHASSDD